MALDDDRECDHREGRDENIVAQRQVVGQGQRERESQRPRRGLSGWTYRTAGAKPTASPTSIAARELTSSRVGWRRRRHVAQELITAVTFDCGEVVRDQPVWPFDCDLDAIL